MIAKNHAAIPIDAPKTVMLAVAQPDTFNFRLLSDALKKRFPQFKFKDLPDESSKPGLDSSRVSHPVNSSQNNK